MDEYSISVSTIGASASAQSDFGIAKHLLPEDMNYNDANNENKPPSSFHGMSSRPTQTFSFLADAVYQIPSPCTIPKAVVNKIRKDVLLFPGHYVSILNIIANYDHSCPDVIEVLKDLHREFEEPRFVGEIRYLPLPCDIAFYKSPWDYIDCFFMDHLDIQQEEYEEQHAKDISQKPQGSLNWTKMCQIEQILVSFKPQWF